MSIVYFQMFYNLFLKYSQALDKFPLCVETWLWILENFLSLQREFPLEFSPGNPHVHTHNFQESQRNFVKLQIYGILKTQVILNRECRQLTMYLGFF